MLKLNQLLLPTTMDNSTRNGMLPMLEMLKRLLPRDLMINLDSRLTDHSTSDQAEKIATKALCMVTFGSTLEDGLQLMLSTLNGDSMKRPRPSTTCIGRTTLCKSTPTVDIHILEPQLLSHPDGGKCSNMKVVTSMLLITKTST